MAFSIGITLNVLYTEYCLCWFLICKSHLFWVPLILSVFILSVFYSESPIFWVYFILSLLCSECPLYWVCFILSVLSVLYTECPLYWVSLILSVLNTECPLYRVSFIMSIVYLDCHVCQMSLSWVSWPHLKCIKIIGYWCCIFHCCVCKIGLLRYIC